MCVSIHTHSCTCVLCVSVCARASTRVNAGAYRGQKRVSDVLEINSCEHPDVGA